MEAIEYYREFFLSPLGIRCLFTSLVVGSMCGALGCFIVLRNMSLLGDALSHAVLPGIVVAFMLLGYSNAGFFIGSVAAGLSSAIAITWLQQKFRAKNDAAIGIIFTFMFALGVIGISWMSDKQGVHLDLKDFLFGNILSVSQQDLYLSISMAVIVFLSIALYYRSLFTTSFQEVVSGTLGINASKVHYFLMLMLSLVVVASLRSVGVILVVSMLITPASAALLMADRLPRVLVWATIIGALSAFLGLLLSIGFDFPAGPSMAVTATLLYFVIGTFAPRKGIFWRWVARKQLQSKVVIEDILKYSMKVKNEGQVNLLALVEQTGYSAKQIKRQLNQLVAMGLFAKKGQEFVLTDEGMKRGNQLIRAHRLWETFLVEELSLGADQIHEEAENAEHMLSESDIENVDEKLGYPQTDPHGSPIPR